MSKPFGFPSELNSPFIENELEHRLICPENSTLEEMNQTKRKILNHLAKALSIVMHQKQYLELSFHLIRDKFQGNVSKDTEKYLDEFYDELYKKHWGSNTNHLINIPETIAKFAYASEIVESGFNEFNLNLTNRRKEFKEKLENLRELNRIIFETKTDLDLN